MDSKIKQMKNALPVNRAVLRHLLCKANRTVEWFDTRIAQITVHAEELEGVVRKPRSYLSRRKHVSDILHQMEKRSRLNEPDIADLEQYLPPFSLISDLFDVLWRAHERWESIVGSGDVSIKVFAVEVPASYAVAEAMNNINDLFRALRSQIIERLIACDGRRRDSATNAPQSVRLPKNNRIVDLARAVQDPRNEGRSKQEIALEFADGDQKCADNLLRQLRRFPRLNARSSATHNTTARTRP